MNQSLFLLQCVGYHAYYGLQGPQVLGLAWILQNRKWRAAAMAHHCTDLVAIVVALPAENCSGGPECIKSMKPGTYINILTLFLSCFDLSCFYIPWTQMVTKLFSLSVMKYLMKRKNYLAHNDYCAK